MDKEHGFPWVTLLITAGLAVFYPVFFTHSYTWSFTPLDAVIGTVLTGLVPVSTCYVLSRFISWIFRKPYDSWTTEKSRT